MYRSGDIIDQYRLSKELGSGSYGVVFEATNTVSGQICALKIIPLYGRAAGRELKALRQYHNIKHPNLLLIHHSGVVGDFLYYTMDLAEGKLADQHLSPAQLRSAAIKLADALASLHEHGLIHRDLKPDNLLFLKGEPLIGDIGLVTADCGASLTGTPGFIPPAIRENGSALSERSDLYALAKSFYCLLSGNPPGDYPKYAGPIDPDASILLQCVLTVCDDRKEISSAVEFRDFLRTEKILPKTKRRGMLIFFAAIFLIAAGIGSYGAGTWISRSSPGKRMFAVIRKAEQYSPIEKAAIDRQERVYAKMAAEIKKQADNKYHAGRRISMNTILKKQSFYEDLLEESIQKQAVISAEFRCFYVLRKNAEQAAFALYTLETHPEYAPNLKKEFQLWQKKYAAYCKERDKLLFQ